MTQNTLHDFHDYLFSCSRQRAVIMALLASILNQDEGLSIRNAKIAITNAFSNMIDEGTTVNDSIEKDFFERIVVFLEQEHLLEQFTKD